MGRKAPHPRMRDFFFLFQIYPFQAIWSNFLVFGFCGTKAPPPQHEGTFFDYRSISFQAILRQLWFLWQKSPHPQDERKYFYFRSIHFRQFPATLVFVAEKPHPPPSKDEGKFFDIRSIHFRQFPATLVFVVEKPHHLGWGKMFWFQIYPFQAISSNFGFCGRKAPLLFCLFITDQACITQVEYPRFPYYKSILRFLLSEYLL